jgi:aspartyl-tRNA(Asn)/glutamyl-tRNA(Gln) amidotransferase subunit B
MNSIRSVGRALAYEEQRQRKALDDGVQLVQETRHFDEKTGSTSSLRTKEYAFDYRYFPEPDLVPLAPSEELVSSVRESLPEFPAQRRARFVSEMGIGETEAGILTTSRAVADWFEEAVGAYGGEAKKISNWIIADLYGLLNEEGIDLPDAKVTPQNLAALVKMIDSGAISGKQAKTVLAEMFRTGNDPAAVAKEKGLEQLSDTSAIESVVDEVIAEQPDAAEKVRGGQMNTIGFLVGQVMKKTRGQANPGVVNELLRKKLS